jgi:pimeloyl-ACP methyl ester carboxylesterase
VPSLSRPDGTTIHWEQCGDGPLLYAAHNVMIAMPSTFQALLDDLALDHRVVTWDPRGAGESSRDDRYDFDTDAGDLAALVEEVGRPGVFLVLGFNPLPLALADRRPESVAAVILVAGTVQLRLSDSALFDSESVITAMLQLARTDPRALLRSTLTLGNPQLSEAELHERLEAQLAYCPVESWVGRAESYVGIDARRACTALRDRLWIVYWPNPISPESPVERLRGLLPHAHVVETEDGPISRPDLVAAVVREATASLALD